MGVRWSIWFVLLCRLLWLNRNASVFREKAVGSTSSITQVKMVASWYDINLFRTGMNESEVLYWKRSYVGRYKYNVDGVCNSGTSHATCGRIAWDW